MFVQRLLKPRMSRGVLSFVRNQPIQPPVDAVQASGDGFNRLNKLNE